MTCRLLEDFVSKIVLNGLAQSSNDHFNMDTQLLSMLTSACVDGFPVIGYHSAGVPRSLL